MASAKRDHLVETALKLFGAHGFHATGIDRILAESGVAKMTLYNHFRSKDELILAVLRRRDERFRNWFMRAVEGRAKSPRARLTAIFDVLETWFSEREFHGCLFINATAEFCTESETIRASCEEHKGLMRGYLRKLAAAAGARDPQALAEGINLLIEGAIVTAQCTGNAKPAKQARRAAAILIRDALTAEKKSWRRA